MLEGLPEGRHHLQLVGHSGRVKKEVRGVKSAGSMGGIYGYTDDSAAGVRIVVSRKRWAKAKRLLVMLHELVLASEWVDHKMLERIRGFMVCVDCTYTPFTPFLVGLHMSIDGWGTGRDDEDWRLRQAELEASRDSDDEGYDEGFNPSGTILPPGQVKVVPRLMPDFKVMVELTAANDPPLRRVRARSKINILNFYEDASGSGFGWCIYLGDVV
jgi:hypothetical protein